MPRVRGLGMRLFLVLAALFGVAFGAEAVNCTQYRYGLFGSYGPWVPTADEACESANGATFVPYGSTTAVMSGAYRYDASTCRGTQTIITNCSPNCTSTRSFGYTSRTGDYCEPDKCEAKAGTPTTFNGTFGWSLENRGDPDATWWDSKGVGDFSYSKVGEELCVEGCKAIVDSLEQAYQSKERYSNGMYRWSVDYKLIPTGASCTAGQETPAHMKPGTPEPSCPGAVGEVNGERVCIPGSGHAPSNAASAVADVGSTPITAGNPSAGEKPSTGPGSGEGGVGRTPLVGNGGNPGGSSSAAGGELPTGPPGGGTEGDPYRPKDPCGLPGTPACKIDERGTPSSGDFSGAQAALEAAADGIVGAITDATTPKSIPWLWGGIALPAGACSDMTVASPWPTIADATLNLCDQPWVSWWRFAWAWIAGALTMWYVYGRFTRAVNREG